MTFCIHFERFSDDMGGAFVNDQFLVHDLISQWRVTTYIIMFVGRLPQSPVDLLGQFRTVELCHALKDGLKDNPFRVCSDVLRG